MNNQVIDDLKQFITATVHQAVTGAVVSLRHETDGLYRAIDGLHNEIDGLHNEIDGLHNAIAGLHNETDGLHHEIDGLRQELRTGLVNAKTDLNEFKIEVNTRFDSMEIAIGQTNASVAALESFTAEAFDTSHAAYDSWLKDHEHRLYCLESTK